MACPFCVTWGCPGCVDQEEETVGAPQWWRLAPDPGSPCFTVGTMIGTPVRLTGNPSFVVAATQLTSVTTSRILELIGEATPAEPATASR